MTITFGDLMTDGAPVSTYTEGGFTLSAMSGSWGVRTTYGNPAPFIQFLSVAGSAVVGQIRVTAVGSTSFSFKSVDLYSRATPIPYTIGGLRNSNTVFLFAGEVPFGDFKTVANARAADVIDTLSIALFNSSAPCCYNPMGLDNIVLSQ